MRNMVVKWSTQIRVRKQNGGSNYFRLGNGPSERSSTRVLIVARLGFGRMQIKHRPSLGDGIRTQGPCSEALSMERIGGLYWGFGFEGGRLIILNDSANIGQRLQGCLLQR